MSADGGLGSGEWWKSSPMLDELVYNNWDDHHAWELRAVYGIVHHRFLFRWWSPLFTTNRYSQNDGKKNCTVVQAWLAFGLLFDSSAQFPRTTPWTPRSKPRVALQHSQNWSQGRKSWTRHISLLVVSHRINIPIISPLSHHTYPPAIERFSI